MSPGMDAPTAADAGAAVSGAPVSDHATAARRWASAVLRHFVVPANAEPWLPPAPPAPEHGRRRRPATPVVDVWPGHGAASHSEDARDPRAVPHVDDRDAAAGGGRRAVVLGAAADVPAVAAAVANEVRGRAGAVVCVWSPDATAADLDAPATPGARRVATEVHAADAPTTARGRLAWTTLPADPATATTHVERVAGAPASRHDEAGFPADHRRSSPGRPGTVLAIAGPRPAEFDGLLAAADLVVLVVRPSDAVLGDVARQTLAHLPAAVVTVPPLHGPAKIMALAGIGRLPQVRPRPVTEAAA